MSNLSRYILRCKVCGHRWKTPPRRNPPRRPVCPNLDCGTVVENRGIDLTIPKAPAQIGGNPYVRAADETAEMVMKDYSFTDLQGGGSSLRPGDVMAPKLEPRLQEQADNFFGPPPGAKRQPMPFNVNAAIASAGAPVYDGQRHTIEGVGRGEMKPRINTVASV